jgi:hypothetical protein
VWSSTRILWDQQILLLWILLPPVFVACGFLALAAPFIVSKEERRRADRREHATEQTVTVDGGQESLKQAA